MTTTEMIPYQRWFGQYAKGFLEGAPERDKQAMGLKLVHSQRVRQVIKDLATKVGLQTRALFLAELAGLFHDIGRLEQFRRYHTFMDSKSEDHAKLSVEVLKEENVLKDLHIQEKEDVLDAIFVHNKLEIPRDFSGRKLTLSKLLRDADKIDIWRVFDDFYQHGKGSEDINLGLPPGESISPEVLEEFKAAKIVKLKNVKNQLDFLVVRLSWLYDLNYIQSLEEILTRGYLKNMLDLVPSKTQREEVSRIISAFLRQRGLKVS